MIFDLSEQTFRNELYADYKAHRPDMPEDLVPQFPLIRDAVRAFNVACLEQKGYEADDLIATYAREAAEAGADVTIVSSDKDLMQLVRPGVRMYDTMKNKVIGEDEVMERFGVPPTKVIEVQALIGDPTDNVPGVPGIGVKTAALLINEYGDLDTLLARASEITQPKRRESLITFADQARLSRTLVILDTHVPLDVPLAETSGPPARGRDAAELHAQAGVQHLAPPHRRRPRRRGSRRRRACAQATAQTRRGLRPPVAQIAGGRVRRRSGPSRSIRRRKARLCILPKSVPPCSPRFPSTAANTRRWSIRSGLPHSSRRRASRVMSPFAPRSRRPTRCKASLSAWRFRFVQDTAVYVPLGHRVGDGLDLGGEGEVKQMKTREALDLLKPLLEDASVLKIVQNAKFDMVVLARYGIALTGFDDPCLMSYALDAGRAEHLPEQLAGALLCYTCLTHKEIMGTGRAAVTFERVPVARATEFAGEEADIGLRLWLVLKPRLIAEHVDTVYETLERPIAPVLALMEQTGIRVERATLATLSGNFAQTIARLEDEIRELAGEDFNIGSPKQLGEILFDKMSLAGGRRTKTGAWSTDASALEELAAEGHELPRKVLDWRLLAKLKSTYTDALPTYIHPETGRVHTSYALAATTTGRLSSLEPNLQNIPVRTSEGRAIRKAFVSDKGKRLISADYSQIELRVLAHMADTPTLRQAFADGLDIHAMTASEMFGVPIEGMDPAIRRRAKAINFGIVYGISAVGLAAQLGIGRSEAGAYIKTYFERFPGIRDYMEATKAEARRQGYVKTLFGRKVHYPEINTKNPSLRGNFERAAINAPIQGLCRRHHPPRHDPHGAGARRSRPQRAHAAAGA